MAASRVIHCTFPKALIREPLLYNLGRDFDVMPNIRGATISDDIGLVYLELHGSDADIEQAVAYLADRGVTVQPVDGDIPEDGSPPPSA